MSTIPERQTSTVNPEEVRSALNAAFADFLAVEPSNSTSLITHHQQNLDSTILTNETTDNDHESTQNSRPPTPYTVSTPTNNGIHFRLIIHI